VDFTYEKEYAEFLLRARDRAEQLFKESEENAELQREAEDAEAALRQKFTKEDFLFIFEKIDAFITQTACEGAFLYRQAYKDCVSLLKRLEIIR